MFCTLHLSVSDDTTTTTSSAKPTGWAAQKNPCCLRKLTPAPPSLHSSPHRRPPLFTSLTQPRRRHSHPLHFKLLLKIPPLPPPLPFFKIKRYPQATCSEASCVGTSQKWGHRAFGENVRPVWKIWKGSKAFERMRVCNMWQRRKSAQWLEGKMYESH